MSELETITAATSLDALQMFRSSGTFTWRSADGENEIVLDTPVQIKQTGKTYQTKGKPAQSLYSVTMITETELLLKNANSGKPLILSTLKQSFSQNSFSPSTNGAGVRDYNFRLIDKDITVNGDLVVYDAILI